MKNKKFWISLLAGILAAIMILSLFIGALSTYASAASSSEIKEQIDSMKEKQDALQDQLDDLEAQREENLSEIQEIVDQKSLVDQQISLLHDQVDNMNDQISAYAVLLADKQAELDEAQARLAELNEKNKERIRAMEEDGQLSYWSVLFAARNFSDLLDRLDMVQEIAAADRRRLEEMSEAAEKVAQAQKVLQEERAQLMLSREALKEKEAELDAKAEKAKELLTSLLAKGEEFEVWITEKEEELADFEQELADMEVEYDKKKYEEWLATSVPPTTVAPDPNYSGTGLTANKVNGITWLTPCNYEKISSKFGWRIHPVYKDWRFHKGVDLGVGHTPIYATRAGVVVIAQWNDSAGYYVTIDHGDGYRSVYMHMCTSPYVSPGDFVAAGQVIGCVGTTGTSTGLHLHFGISYEGEYVNPLDYIK